MNHIHFLSEIQFQYVVQDVVFTKSSLILLMNGQLYAVNRETWEAELILPGTVQCQVQYSARYSARYSTVPGTVPPQNIDHFSTIFNIMISTVVPLPPQPNLSWKIMEKAAFYGIGEIFHFLSHRISIYKHGNFVS